MREFYERVWNTMRRIPRGRVTTYGELARALNTRAYRAVGGACRHNPYAPEVPCHRVIKSTGDIGGFGGKISGRSVINKVRLLRNEGVQSENGKIDLKKYFYKFG